MKYTLLLVFLMSFFNVKGQEIWQLSPWATDSTYVLGALGSGEPSWVHIDSLGITGGGGVDSTILISGYGIDITESPANTYTIKADTGEVATLYDVSLKLGSLNGLTAPTQTFTTLTTASDFTITSSVSTHSFGLPFTGNTLGLRLGYNSLRRDNSVAVGINCLGSAGLSATNNVAIGNDVLRVAGSTGSGGTNNVGLGFQSLYSNTTGINNFGLGTYALYNLTSGSNNIAIGAIAGLTLSTQSENTMIGYESGRFNTGAGNIFLGFQSGRSETGSNKLYIDNADSSTPLIGGDLSANRVGINTGIGSIARTLHVTGEARITDLTTDTPTVIVGADTDGDLGTVTLGTGLSLSGGTLAATNNGTITGSGTTGYVPQFTSSTAIGNSTAFSNSNGFGFGTTNPLFALHLNNRSIYLQGNSNIIDKNNSGGLSGYFLMGTGGFGVDWEFLELSRTGARDLSLTGGSTLVNCLVPTVGVSGQVLTNTGSGTYAFQNDPSQQYAQLYYNGSTTVVANTGTILSNANFATLTYSGTTGFSNSATNRIRCDFTGTVQINIDATWEGGNGSATTHSLNVYKNGSGGSYPSVSANNVALSGTQREQHTYRNSIIVDVTLNDYFEFYYTAPASTTLVLPLMTIKRIK
jgi:hypothetical protein